MALTLETTKDVVQELTESASTRVGNIANIVTDAVREVTREIGDWISDSVEATDAIRKPVEEAEVSDVLEAEVTE